MAKRKNDTLGRRVGIRKYRDICWVSAEGHTEKDYFSMAAFKDAVKSIKFPRNIHPARRNPEAVLKRFEKSLRDNDFRKEDEAWLAIDTDEWNEEEFFSLLEWVRKDARHNLAVSNPKFELFLIMHFQKGNGCTTPAKVDAMLKRHLPGYEKRIGQTQFSIEEIKVAAENARIKRICCDADLPEAGMTDVYKLVQSVLGE